MLGAQETMAATSFLSSSASSGDEGMTGRLDALPSAAAIAGLVGAGAGGGAGAGAGGRTTNYSYYESFLSSSRMMRTGEGAAAAAASGLESDEEDGEGAEEAGGGLRHALGVIERLQEQLRIVRGEKQGLEERLYLLQRENASLLATTGGQQQAATTAAAAMSALSTAAELKGLEAEAREARERLVVVERELAAEREEGRALRVRLASAEAQLTSREALVSELRAKYEKGRETLREAERKHLEALERVFHETQGAGPAIGEEERERWRRDLGVAREEANELREELLHRREEARALKDQLRTLTTRKPRRFRPPAAEGEEGAAGRMEDGEEVQRLREKCIRRTEQLRLQQRFTEALKKLLAKAKAEAEAAKARLGVAVEEQRELREELAGQTQRYEAVVARLRERLEGLVLATVGKGGGEGTRREMEEEAEALAAAAAEAEAAARRRREHRRWAKVEGKKAREDGEAERHHSRCHSRHHHEEAKESAVSIPPAGKETKKKKATAKTTEQGAKGKRKGKRGQREAEEERPGPMAWQLTFPFPEEEARCRAKGKPAPYEASPVIERFASERRE